MLSREANQRRCSRRRLESQGFGIKFWYELVPCLALDNGLTRFEVSSIRLFVCILLCSCNNQCRNRVLEETPSEHVLRVVYYYHRPEKSPKRRAHSCKLVLHAFDLRSCSYGGPSGTARMVCQAQSKTARRASSYSTLDRPGICFCPSTVCRCIRGKASLLESLSSECRCIPRVEGQEMATRHAKTVHPPPIVWTVLHSTHEHVQVWNRTS